MVGESVSRVLFSRPSPSASDDHSSSARVTSRVERRYPEARADRPQTPPYFVLLRMGFAMRPTLPPAR